MNRTVATWQPASSGADCTVVFRSHLGSTRTHEGPSAHFDEGRRLPPILPLHSKNAQVRGMRTYHLFLSHSWRYSDEYERLISLLRRDRTFFFRDYSVVDSDPILGVRSNKELSLAIKEQMSFASVVLVLAGVYSTYSKWINEELRIAKEGFVQPKPIVAVEPWGSKRTSATVKVVADKVVRWNTKSVVQAIREVAK